MDCNTISLKRGSNGEKVLEVQKDMVTHGYYLGAKFDSVFGPFMEKEIIRLQHDGNLVEDGWFATKTCNYLQSLNNRPVRGYWWNQFEKAMGIIVNNANDVLVNLKLHGAWYEGYYEDIRKNSTIINNLKTGGSANCTDITQLLKRIYEEMGYAVRFIRAEVKCSNGKWYGHVWLEIMGKGYNTWKIVDGSARLSKGSAKPMGTLICTGGVRNRSVNPAWLVNAQDNR